MASSSNSPCAACKLLRRKCQPECVFAPYFPPDQPQNFANVHKVFGASNVAKLLNEIQPHERAEAVSSLVHEAGYRSIQSSVNRFIGDGVKTFARPESEEEKLDRIIKISLDGAKQGAGIVVGHVLSSSNSRVVVYVIIFALFIGILLSMLADLLRKHESVSKVLAKLGLIWIASSVILSFAALFPHVIMSCTFGTIAILLLAFTVMMN